MKIRLIGAKEPLHEDLTKSRIDYAAFDTESEHIELDFCINITGVEPQPAGVVGASKRNGIPLAIKTVAREYSIETYKFYNNKPEDVANIIQLEAWQLSNYKYFTLWNEVEITRPVLDAAGEPVVDEVPMRAIDKDGNLIFDDNGEPVWTIELVPRMETVKELICWHDTALGREYVTEGASFVWVELSSIASIKHTKTNRKDAEMPHRVYTLELTEAVLKTGSNG